MKILLINVTKSKGSTGNLVTSLFNAYKELGHNAYLIYGRESKSNEENIFKETLEFESKLHHALSYLTGNIYGGMYLSTSRIVHRIKKINPDVIHLHCLNGYFLNIYKLIRWLKKSKYTVVLTNHADFMLSANCGYAEECNNWKSSECINCKYVKRFNGNISLNRTHLFYKRMYKAFKDYPKDKLVLTGVSPWLSSRIKDSPIYNGYRVETVLNPVDEFYLKKLNVRKNDKLVLYVTPDYYDQTKSGHYIIDIANKLPNYQFVIVTAKEQKIDSPTNVETLFGVNREKLRELYQASKCTLLLSKRETFSMVAIESLASRTPVVGFKNGGTESWATYGTYLYNYGDVESVVTKIKESFNGIVFETPNYLDIAKKYIALFREK